MPKKFAPMICVNCGEITNRPRNSMCNHCYNQAYREKNKDKLVANAYRWQRENSEKHRAARRKISLRNYYKLTPEQRREKERQRALKMSDKEKSKRNEISRKHYADHKETYSANSKNWKQTHKEQRRVIEERRRALKHGAESDLTTKQWKDILSAYKHCCAYCGKHSNSLTQDHVIPLSKGGKHTASNIVPACRSCNSKKNTKPAPIPVQLVLA